VQLEAKLALADEDDGEADGSMPLSSSVLSLFFLLSVFFFFFAFCVSFAFSMFVSLSVFSLSSSSSVRSFSSPVRPCISLLHFPVPGAVVAKDGALELLLKTKYNGLTLCFSLLFFFSSSSPLSLPCSLCFSFYLICSPPHSGRR